MVSCTGTRFGLGGTTIRITALVFAFFSIVIVGSAQDTLRSRYGVFGHGALSSHSADFARMPGTQSCCAGFTGGTGMGLSGGALAEFPLAPSVTIGARIAVLTQAFSMTTSEATRVIVNGVGQDGAFEHRLTGSIMTLGFEPLLGVRLFSEVFVHVGGRIAIPLSSSYEQDDAITQPSGSGTFLNADGTDSRRRTRNAFSGVVPETAMQISPMVGISYELPLNADGTMLLVPEAFYQLGVMNVMADSSWKASSFRAGIAFKWSPVANKQPQPAEPMRRSTPDSAPEITTNDLQALTSTLLPDRVSEAASNVLLAALDVRRVKPDGSEDSISSIVVEEYSSTLMTPLLPYVFFDENSSQLPTRYNVLAAEQTLMFNIDGCNSSDKLSTYHQLLNVVGKRMQMYPDAKLMVTGNNMELRDEKDNTQLSQRRADVVKQYLTDVWGIATSRIATEARGLPAKAANTLTKDGSEENRRIELYSSDTRLLAPIITSDTLRVSNPPVIRLRPTVEASSGVASWTITATQNKLPLKMFSGDGRVPSSIAWNLVDEQANIPKSAAPVLFTLKVVDSSRALTTASATLQVQQITIRIKKDEHKGDKVVDRFSLILFDVRSAELGTEHNSLLDIIRQRVAPTSTVTITGYTDRLGDVRFNQQLAESRANAVARALKVKTVIIKGVGQADLYESTLPEGRLYTRTVNVVIETPIKN